LGHGYVSHRNNTATVYRFGGFGGLISWICDAPDGTSFSVYGRRTQKRSAHSDRGTVTLARNYLVGPAQSRQQFTRVGCGDPAALLTDQPVELATTYDTLSSRSRPDPICADIGMTPFEATTRLTHHGPPLSQRGRFLEGQRIQKT